MKLISNAYSIPSPAHQTSDDSLILPISEKMNQFAICGIFDGMGSLVRGGLRQEK